MKKIITTCLILMLLSSVFAQTTFTVGGINYKTTSSNTVEVTSGGTYTGNITIPSTINYSSVTYNVTSIGYNAFYNCNALTSIFIPNSVITIGDYSFSNCSGLTSVTIPNSITSIGTSVFRSSGLTSIVIPNSVTSIGMGAFYGCTALTSILIPTSVVTIGCLNCSGQVGAFQSCTSLTSVVIPSSVTSIGNSTFQDCSNLLSLTLPETLKYIGNNLLNGTKWFNNQPDGLVYNSKYLLGYKGNKPTNTTININIETLGIANFTFYDWGNLTTITIPNSVATIGNGAFANCSGLASITIPNSVSTIGNGAFNGCTGLSSITIPNSVKTIEDYAFSGCSGLTSVSIPITVDSIGSNVFRSCTNLSSIVVENNSVKTGRNNTRDILNLKKIKAPASFINISGGVDETIVRSEIYTTKLDTVIINSGEINNNALKFLMLSNRTLKKLDIKESTNTALTEEFLYNFYSLESLMLPKNLQKIQYKEFTECMALKEIIVPATVSEIGKRSFENCRSLTTVTFEANSQLKTIDNWAFYACHGLQSLAIPNGVTTIGDGAFWGCDYMTNVSLPSSMKSISDNGFEGCKSINKITIESTIPPTIFTNTFNKVNKNIPLYVPDESVSLYKSAFGWKDFYNIKGNSTGVSELEESNYLINITNRSIEIKNATGKSIRAFDISGRKVFETSKALDSEQFTVNNKGVYIIAIDNFKKKIMVY